MSAVRRPTADDTIHSRGVAAALFSLESEEEKFADFQQGRSLAQSVGSLEDLEGSINPTRSSRRDSRPATNLDRSPAVLSFALRGGTTPRSTTYKIDVHKKGVPTTTPPHPVRSTPMNPPLSEEEVFVRGHRLPLILDDIDTPPTSSSSIQLVHCAALPIRIPPATGGVMVSTNTGLYTYDPVEGGLVLDSSACNPFSVQHNNPMLDVARRGKLLPSEVKSSGTGPRVSSVRKDQDHHNASLALYHGDHTLVGGTSMGHTALSASQSVVNSLKATCVVNRHNAVVVNLGLDVVQGTDCSAGITSTYASKRRVALHPTEGIVAQYIRMLSSEIKAANADHMYTIEIKAVSVHANDKVVSLLGDRKTKQERRDRHKERRIARDQAHVSRRRDTAAAAMGISRELPAPRLPTSLRPPPTTHHLEGDTWDGLICNVAPVDMGSSHRSQAKVLHHLYKRVLGGGGAVPRVPRRRGLVNIVGRVRGVPASTLGTSQQSGESDWQPDDAHLGRYAEERDAVDDGNSSCFSGDTTGSDTEGDAAVSGDVDNTLGGAVYPVSSGPSFHTIVEVTARAAHVSSLVPPLGRLLVVDCVGYDLLDGARVSSTITASDASALRHAPNTLLQVLGALGAQGRGQKQVAIPHRESFLTHLLYQRLSSARQTTIINNLPLASLGDGTISAEGLPSITTAHEAMELSRKLVSVRYGPTGKAKRLTKAFMHPSTSTTPSSVLVARVVAAAQYYRQRAYTTAVECDAAVREANRETEALRLHVQDLETDRLVLMSALTASRVEVHNLEGVVAQAQASGFGGVGVQIDRPIEDDNEENTTPEAVGKLQDRVAELELECSVGATERDSIRHQYESLISDMESVIVRLTAQVAELTTTLHNQSPIPSGKQLLESHSDPLASALVQGLQDAGLVDTHALQRIVSSSKTQSRVDLEGLGVGVALLQLTQQLCEREKAVETLLRRCAVLVGEQGDEPFMRGGLDAPDGLTVHPSELTGRRAESRNARQRKGRQEFQSTMHALQVELDTAPIMSGDEWRHLLRKQTLGLRAAVVGDDNTPQDDSPPLWLCALGSANFPDARCGVANNSTRVDRLTTPNLFELSTRGTPKSFQEYWRSPTPFVQGAIAAPRHRRAYKLHRSEFQDHSPRYWSRHGGTAAAGSGGVGNASPSRSFSPLGSPFGSMKWAVDNDGVAEPPRNISPPSARYSSPTSHGVVSTPNTSHIEPDEPETYMLDEDRDTTPDPVESPPLPTVHTPLVPLDESTKDTGTPPLAPRPVPPLAKTILRSSDSESGTPRRGSGTPVSVSFAHDALEVPAPSPPPPLNESQDDWPILSFVVPSDSVQPAATTTTVDVNPPTNTGNAKTSPPMPPSSLVTTDDVSNDKREKKSKSDKTEKADRKSKTDKGDKSEVKQDKSKRDRSDRSASVDHKADKPKKEKKDKHGVPSSPLTEEGKKSKKDKTSSS